MKVNLRTQWIHASALATVLLSAGVLIGSYLSPEAAPPPSAPAAPQRSGKPPAAPGPPAAAPPAAAASSAEPHVPAAPGFEPFDAGVPRPEFGGQYAVLRGANTVERPGSVVPDAAVPIASSAPAPAAAVPPAPPEPVLADPPRAESAAAEPSAVPARNRPAPAQGIPRGIALRQPLLAIVRTGGRAVFHDLGNGGGPTPAGLEGEWAVIGRCELRARVDLAMPSRQIGDLRGIGRAEGGSQWSGEPVVPRQACEVASERFTRPRAASDADRGAYAAAGASLGYAASDLRQVLDVRGGVLLAFGGVRGSALVAAVGSGPRVTVQWTYGGEPGDGDLSLVGVYRNGTDVQAWVLLGPRGSPGALMILSSSDLRTWSRSGPFELNQP